MSEITILLAEDDAGHEATIRQALQLIDAAWELEVVHDGVEVLDYLFAMGGHTGRDLDRLPQLILLDLTMPKMGGMQVLQVLRRVRGGERSRMPPVVVLTSSQQDAELVNQQNLGPFTSIHKSVEFDKLVEELRRVTLHWLTWAEPAARKRVRTP
jgi:two-component system response regulator